MQTAKITAVKDFVIGEVKPTVFGSFLEHMGRVIYGGIYQKDHVTADADGFRGDVAECVRALNVPLLRYPGGNFLSGYDWKDGIGKASGRPARLDLAWGQLEPNEIGVLEFFKWTKKVGSELMMSVNTGTGTPRDAAELVEYCNHPNGSFYSDLRIAHGQIEPLKIKYWCVGNEMDGNWQICSQTADEYGRKATETAKMMKWVDRDIKLVVCGSSGPHMSSYPEWDRRVLEHTYPYVDYLSLHRYYEYPTKNRATELTDFLCSYADFDAFIKTIGATCDYVKAVKRSKKDIKLSVDEWNVWHTDDHDCSNDARWTVGPARVENNYDTADVIVFSQLMLTLINNCDRVEIGCLAQLVNTIAPIMTEGGKNGRCLKQTIYYPFLLGCLKAKGQALRTINTGAKMHSARYGDADTVMSATTLDEQNRRLTVFVVNADANAETALEIDLKSFGGKTAIKEHICVGGGERGDKNTFDAPNCVLPKNLTTCKGDGGVFTVKLPRLSFSAITFDLTD